MMREDDMWLGVRRLAAGLAAAVAALPAEAGNAGALETAARLVAAGGAPGGICAVVGAAEADLPLALSRQGNFVVHSLAGDAAACERLREAFRAAGSSGAVSAGALAGVRLPYADNILNLAVVDAAWNGGNPAPEELLRVLAPLGAACVGVSSGAGACAARLKAAGFENVAVIESGGAWVCGRKPWPAEIDEWGHYLHGADGNPVARDRVVGPPARFQWVAEPRWLRCHETDSSVSALVTARGRLFAIVDEAPISLPGNHPLPDKWFLVARDAFNGVLLWKVPIQRWGWREWKDTWWSPRPGDIPLNIQKRLVAAGDRVYATLGYNAPVSQLDARTGEILRTYPGTEGACEILERDGTLVLSVLEAGGARVKAVDAGSGRMLWSSAQVYRGSVTDYIKWGSKSGGVDAPKLDPTLNAATGGNAVALIDATEIVVLDFATGAEKWRGAFPLADEDRTAAGMNAGDNLWVGTMIVSGGAVIHASPNKLAAFDAETGKLLWEQAKRYIGHLWYEWKDVFVIDGLVWTWGADLGQGAYGEKEGRPQRGMHPTAAVGYDLRTGERRREVALGALFAANHHHRCYRNKATERYILTSRRGTEFVDLSGGRNTLFNWVRGTCHFGMMPANGLQYAPPHPCACYIEEKLNGFNALAPAGPATPAPESPCLLKGPAFGSVAESPAPSPADWPAFRHDGMRTGTSAASVPDGFEPLWRVRAGAKISPPSVVGDRIFVALVDEHHVACFDRKDGRMLWEQAAGGRIDSPPTWHAGTVLFGSADGWMHCVRASDGAVVWRFRAAPAERLIGAYGQLESAWPVHGSVLVQSGLAYCAAGRSSHLDGGIRLCAVDAATGELRHEARLQGPDYAADEIKENFRLPEGTLPDILASDGTLIYMRSAAFDAGLGKVVAQKPRLQAVGGFLDDTYFKRAPWSFGAKSDYGNIIAHDNEKAYFVRMFDSLKGLDPTVYFTPGAKGYMIFGKNAAGGGGIWTERVPVRVRAMALASNRLFAAGPPDVVDPKDPLGAFEGRKGGLLYSIDANAGKRVAEHALDSPPVFNGIAAAGDRLYLSLEDGSLVCFGKKENGAVALRSSPRPVPGP